jgi:hypothetical protein
MRAAAVIAPGGPLGGLPLGPLLGGELGALQARLDRFGVWRRGEAVRGRVETGLERGFGWHDGCLDLPLDSRKKLLCGSRFSLNRGSFQAIALMTTTSIRADSASN